MQKLNSYILQSSCRGGTQRMVRSDIAHSAHIHGYQHITIYVHSEFATNASLSILSVQPCMHPHTTQSPLTYTFALPATFITTYVLLNQRHDVQMIISRSKELRRSQPLQKKTSQDLKKLSLKHSTPCMWHIQYERTLIPIIDTQNVLTPGQHMFKHL